VYIHTGKICLTTVGIEPRTFGIPWKTTVVRYIFKIAQCGYTLRVTSQASYSPEYITPTQKNHYIYNY
jgi:hypothetical protein